MANFARVPVQLLIEKTVKTSHAMFVTLRFTNHKKRCEVLKVANSFAKNHARRLGEINNLKVTLTLTGKKVNTRIAA